MTVKDGLFVIGTGLLCVSIIFAVVAILFPAQATEIELEVFGVVKFKGGSIALAAALFYGVGGLLIIRPIYRRISGGEVRLVGFGTFSVAARAASEGGRGSAHHFRIQKEKKSSEHVYGERIRAALAQELLPLLRNPLFLLATTLTLLAIAAAGVRIFW